MKTTELCNVPPAPTGQKIDLRTGRHYLLLQPKKRYIDPEIRQLKELDRVSAKASMPNQLFFCDKEDFEKAKHILWWFDDSLNCPVNKLGITFMEYVGIVGSRLTEGVEKYNFCRVCYV